MAYSSSSEEGDSTAVCTPSTAQPASEGDDSDRTVLVGSEYSDRTVLVSSDDSDRTVLVCSAGEELESAPVTLPSRVKSVTLGMEMAYYQFS